MQVECKPLTRMKLSAFADEHGLVMETVERSQQSYCGTDFVNNRWYANFRRCEVTDGHFLTAVAGNGPTPAQAIRDYASKISEKRLMINAYTSEPKEIRAPVLYV